jgi:PKD repeat protein
MTNNKKQIWSLSVFLILLALFCLPAVNAAPLPDINHIYINVANDDGVKYDLDGSRYWGPDNTYFINSEGNLYEIHVSNDVDQNIGQVSTSPYQSGVFYITNTAGRGYCDDVILLLAVNGTIPDDFWVRIKSSGYEWTPSSVTNQLPTQYQYVEDAMDETFTKNDFIYGPQTWKPGPGRYGVATLPLFSGLDVSDTTNTFQLMFIDLAVGNMYPSRFSGATLENNGAVKVEYSFHNLTTFATFNGYGWCLAAREGQGISWTNRMDGPGSSVFAVIGGDAQDGDGDSGGLFANFTAVPESGSAPCLVRFTDTSTGEEITGYRWDFGDGSISTEQNPSHIYQSSGVYTATLKVFYASGSDTASRTITINGDSGPEIVADFSASVSAGPVPLEVQFTDRSSGATSWNWNFGDGSTSTVQNPVHVYSSSGTYTVTLTVSGQGITDTATATILVTGGSTGPADTISAGFSASPSAGPAPLTVRFTDRSSGATSWNWDFGDGKTSSVQNPVHIYTSSGTYTVTLMVTGQGGSDTATSTILVTRGTTSIGDTVEAKFSASPMVGRAPLTVQFTDRSTGATSWNWDFGDGTTSTVANPIHIYTASGTYKVTLSVSGQAGSDTATGTIKVMSGSAIPGSSLNVLQFNATPMVGRAPLEVQFTDLTSGATSWNWNFGDGTTSTEQNPLHLYTNVGTYRVTLTATIGNIVRSATKIIWVM